MNNLRQLSTISMTILYKYKDNFDTATTTSNKSMSFDPSATNPVSSQVLESGIAFGILYGIISGIGKILAEYC